ncbi:DUF6042 family protein [Streptomyces ardesiacus]|uniref:DUF6042 family protein n=1 Tax=Streptomyces ardesiacus TaxID=285564 RepID=UPI0027E37418|nr:DUF6042 family protein [Streptomyces ardesiacus]
MDYEAAPEGREACEAACWEQFSAMLTTVGFPVPTTVRDLSELYLTWGLARREETPDGTRWSMPAALPLPGDLLPLDPELTERLDSIRWTMRTGPLLDTLIDHLVDDLGEPTPTTQNCTDTRNASALSGPAPYWTSYTYNTAGQRATETEHTSTATAKTTYCYTNTEQPHTLTGTTSKADCTTPERTYTYDTTGNTTQRPGAAGDSTQNLAWSDEGKLTQVTEGAQSSDYLYGADGTLLIRTTENGERVLYAGTTELHLRADGTTWAQRYYTADGITAGMRTNQTGTTNVTFLISDHHGTSSLAVDRLDQKYTKRYTTPFGEDRGKPLYGPWPDDKGFLGKTRDITTGLTHIDAREYDPTIGQFISVDPLLEANRPQTLNGYSYGANNPLTFSDPSGMGLACDGAGGAPEGCPTRLDGSKGNGRPNEAVSTPPANWNNEGQGGAGAVDLDGDGQITLLRNLYIPSTTKDLQTFVQAFYNQVEQNSVGYGIASNADRDDWHTRQEISEALMDACYHTRCSNWKQFFASYVKMTIVAGVGEGGLGKGVGRGSKTGGCKCFLAGTNVLLVDGQTKDIKDIRPGDTVMAKDPETGEEGPRKVTRLIRTEDDKNFNTLSIATEDGIEKLTATHEHPFWSPSEGAWVEAGNLTPGTTLLTDDGDTVIVTANHAYTSHAATYNLTVDDIHTYYVLAGGTPVLVHNSGAGPDPTSFSNLIPADTPEYFKPIAPGTVLLRSGNYAYVVTGDGELVIGKRTAGHVSLAQGRDVLAAGEFKTKGGQVVYLDNKSGHYQPYGAHAQKAAVDAFDKNGLGADGKYIEAWRPSC